jgi:hypothetical protein
MELEETPQRAEDQNDHEYVQTNLSVNRHCGYLRESTG